MYELAAFRDRIAALYRRADPYGDGRRPTQQDLADAVGLSRTELSRRLNGLQNARLAHRDVHAIIQTLVEWAVLDTQAEVRELLAMVDCPDFTPAEWQAPPLDELTPAPLGAIASPTSHPPSSHLPYPTTSFIGREPELFEVTRLVSARRLVTLIGAGGCGKTRLALEVAARTENSFSDGAYLVELAGLRDPSGVPLAIAAAFGIEEQPGQPISETMRRHLQHKDLLLVLDNCEHLVAAAASLVRQLLESCPRLHVLATSREPLRLTSEVRHTVLPLTLPPAQANLSVEDTLQFEAVQLFVARAQAVRATFRLTAENVAAVIYICARLDGLPLALELAAAPMQVMTAAQIAAQLAERFPLPSDRRRDIAPRHRTLTALIDWSYRLLTAAEQALFRHLAVFSGGFTLEAAAATMGATPLDVLDQLTELLNKSLIQTQAPPSAIADDGGEEPRFAMLQTIREYAGLRLREADEEHAAQQAHAAYFQQLAAQAQSGLISAPQSVWLARLEREYNNLTVAIAWSLANQPEATAALQICAAPWRFWRSSGRLSEGRRLLAAALARSDGAAATLRAEAFASAGCLAYSQSDYLNAKRSFEAALTLQRELNDERAAANSLGGLGAVAFMLGDYQLARKYNEQALAVKRNIGDRQGMASSLYNLAMNSQIMGDYHTAHLYAAQTLAIYRELGSTAEIAETLAAISGIYEDEEDYASALKLLQEAVSMLRAMGDRWHLSNTLASMTGIEIKLGDYGQARILSREALLLFQQSGDLAGTCAILENIALLAEAEEQPSRAATLWAAAITIHQRHNIFLMPIPQARYERSAAAIRAALGNAAFARAWVIGQVMSVEQAIEYALSDDGVVAAKDTTYP